MMSLKEKIILESLKLFSLKGFFSTSLQDILQAANTSKGGFYNHFKSKEDLFYAVLDEARKIWREKNLSDLHQLTDPLYKLEKLLENYRDRYLKDSINFPGGCVFITLSVELNDQSPHLSNELQRGFNGLKGMISRLLNQAKESGSISPQSNTTNITEIIFAGMLGASVIFGTNKSTVCLDCCINALIEYVNGLKQKQP